MNRDVQILRESISKITEMLAGRGLKVTQRGMQAYVSSGRDGVPKQVNIPYLPDNASEGFVLAIQGFIDHEVAHVLFTDFKVRAEAGKLGKRHDKMHNIIEDTFIEREMPKRFEGAAYNLTKTQEFFLKEFIDPRFEHLAANPDAGEEQFASILMVPMMRAWSGQTVFQDYMTDKWGLVGTFVAKLGDLTDEVSKVGSTRDSLELTKKILERLEEPDTSGTSDESGDAEGKDDSEDKELDKDRASSEGDKSESSRGDEDDGLDPDKDDDKEPSGDEPADEETSADGDSSPVGSDGDEDDAAGESDPGESDKPKDDGEAAGEAPPSPTPENPESDAERSEGEVDEGEASDADDRAKDPKEVADGDSDTVGEGDHFDWDEMLDEMAKSADFDDGVAEALTKEAASAGRDADYLIYSRDWDLIERFRPRRVAADDVARLDDRVRHMVGVMQKDLERMMAARSRVLKVPGYRSGKLHAASLHRLAAGDDRVFRRRQVHKSKELAASLLIDCSGSMVGSRLPTAAAAAYAMSQTLERIGIIHEVLGFTTRGFGGHGVSGFDMAEVVNAARKAAVRYSRTEPIHMPIFKEFHERLATDVKRRFAGMTEVDCCNNIDGECVEIAGLRLAQRREERKVLIVLSDGAPCADGSRDDQARHLRGVISNLERVGVETIGIGIQTIDVKRYYKKHVVLNNLESLPGEVMKQLQGVLL